MTDLHLTHSLQAFIAEVPNIKRVWLAYSGGLDSTVLMHAAAPLLKALALGVVHVNHKISPNADAWQRHCEMVATQLGFQRIHCAQVSVDRSLGGLEQAARNARYKVFAQIVEPGDLLLTAHHLHDQSETFLLRLMRGAGLRGLGAMQPLIRFQHGFLGRPFLDVEKAQLLEYAQRHRLDWIDDESNESELFDRNYLRLNVLPVLKQRWPALDRQIYYAAQRLQTEHSLLERYLKKDFSRLDLKQERVGESIDMSELKSMEIEQQFALIRFWLNLNNYLMPSQAQLHQLSAVVNAAQDASPLLSLAECEIRRYKNRLYCLPAKWQSKMLTEAKEFLNGRFDCDCSIYQCNVKASMWGYIPQAKDRVYPLASLHLKRGHPQGRQHSQTIKKLMQEYAVEPWLRPHWPVILRERELVCAVGLWVEKQFAQSNQGIWLDWRID